LKRKTESVQHV